MVAFAQKIDRWLHQHLTLLLLLLFLVVLRIPNFFEPYWYGDEGIYLTIGNALRDGQRLYTDIVDHKTPLIYYLAAVPNQLNFRVLTLGWMIVATMAFFQFARKLLTDHMATSIAGVTFVILTSLPWLEGNIPNGELFVMGFVLVGAWLITRTTWFNALLTEHVKPSMQKDFIVTALAGIFFGLGILTKVPALFDWAAFMFVGWLLLCNRISFTPHTGKQFGELVLHTGTLLGVFTVGVLIPILGSILYFTAIGSGQDYLNYGLLYNFRYAASWGLPFSSVLLQKLFTLKGKVIVVGLLLFILSVRKQWFSPTYQFIAAWFLLSFFASLLSNRPYPHYFLQVIPAFSLLVGLTAVQLEEVKKHFRELSFTAVMIALVAAVFILLKFAPYQTAQYYGRFINLMTGRWDSTTYRQSFNPFMTDNYQAASIIKHSETKQIFIWGTNAMLYALSDTYPVGKYTVSFHIKDFKAEEETMEAIRAKKPLFIIVMNDEKDTLPGLEEYLEANYLANMSFQHFTLWKRVDIISNDLLL